MYLLLLACALSPDPPGTTSSTSTDTAWDVSTAAADIQAEIVEEVVTMIRVRWTTEVETRGRVRFGDSEALGRQTDRTDLGTEHEVLLLGLPELTDVHFQVISEDSDRVLTWASDIDSITNGPLPSYLPILTATGTAPSWDDVIVGPLVGSVAYALMIDNQGRIVWYDGLPTDGQLMRTSLSRDKRSMITFMAGPRGALEEGYVRRTSLDLSESSTMATPGVDHDMIERPDGGYAAIVVVEAPHPEGAPENSLADAIWEFDLDGSTREVWNAWDTLASHSKSNTNWTHGNALDFDAASNNYLMSMKDFYSIVSIDAETGQTNWMLGGEEEDFTYLEGTSLVPHHHQFEWIETGLVIFDNGDALTGASRAVELSLDLDTMTADSVWSYSHDPDYLVTAKGDVNRFADGNTQIVWSSAGEIQDVSPLGEVVWQLNTDSASFVFAEHADLYRGD